MAFLLPLEQKTDMAFLLPLEQINTNATNIIIFDISGSMALPFNKNQSRIEIALDELYTYLVKNNIVFSQIILFGSPNQDMILGYNDLGDIKTCDLHKYKEEIKNSIKPQNLTCPHFALKQIEKDIIKSYKKNPNKDYNVLILTDGSELPISKTYKLVVILQLQH